MQSLILIILVTNGVLLSMFVCYHLLFFLSFPICKLIEVFSKEKGSLGREDGRDLKFAVIIPAHNEELMIQKVVESAKSLEYPKDKFQIIVIADNCTDSTADIVRDAGVRCEERKDEVRRGKPYALHWFFRKIDVSLYDAFVIIDADTLIDRNFLRAMNEKMLEGAEIVQGYFGVMNPEDSWLTRLSVITGVIKFRIRYYCKTWLRLSCPLMGNGMCFSRAVITRYGWNAYSLTENWEYYANLVLDGYVPTYAEKALIYSHMVVKLAHGETQRKRWITGRVQISLKSVPRLLVEFLKRKSAIPLDAAVELLLPSHSMLFNWSVLSLTLVLVLHSVGLCFPKSAIAVQSGIVVVQVLFFAVGLLMSRAPIQTWISLLFIPTFLFWRFLVTVKAVLGIRRKTKWEKTNRTIKP